MTISDIYRKYTIPPNLARHQCEVAAVGRYICDHWVDEAIDKELITLALLLHDMGNIIKFQRPFLGELEKDGVYWEKIQDEFIKKYGSDVHKATCAIVSELHQKRALSILQNLQEGSFFGYENLSFEVKICEYADCCVTPNGIVGFKVRLADLMNRYNRTADEHWTKTMTSNARDIEKRVNVDLSKIDEVDFSNEMKEMRGYQLA